MNIRIDPPDRIYTWVDIDSHLSRLAAAGGWPEWLLEAIAFWDTLELVVEAPVDRLIVEDWVESVFGIGSVRRGDESLCLTLDDVSGRRSRRALEIVQSIHSPAEVRRIPKWREGRIVPDLQKPIPPGPDGFRDSVNVVAMYSFKGGVGRTLHAVALAEVLGEQGHRVLLVDGDMEAPGITWMYAASGKRADFAYEDFLALLHGSTDGSPDEAVEIGASVLPNQTHGNVVILPSRRALDQLEPPRIAPADLLTPSRSPYYLTESLAALGSRVGADVVIVDLRAGVSELASSVLLDSRVKRVFVTTSSSQSVEGTELILKQLGTRAPRRADDPAPTLVITQFASTELPERIANVAAPLLDLMAQWTTPGSEDEIDLSLELEPVLSTFQESLLGLPTSWSDVTSLVKRAGLTTLMANVAADVTTTADGPEEPPTGSPSESTDLQTRRANLAEFSKNLAFAETSKGQSFLSTDSLRNLVLSHRTELPIAVVTGAKGAGKTFTQLQMCYRETWKRYATDAGVADVEVDVPLVPLLTSRNVSDDIAAEVTRIRQLGVAEDGMTPISMLDIRSQIQQGIQDDLGELAWRELWLSFLLQSMGIAPSDVSTERSLADVGQTRRRIFLIDGLEDILQDIATSKIQQRALRVLMVDCIEWLRSLRGRPFGLVVFVRIDLVRAALVQNSAQFLARYQDYALRWDPSEAVRLALWVAQESGALANVEAAAVISATDDELSELMTPVWGDKMGTERSREARSRGWFLAALSDFNGNIQARDVVTFIGESAAKAMSDQRWSDRMLTPNAMREALVACSIQKINAISEESPPIGQLLTRLRALPEDSRQVPFTQDSLELTTDEIGLLETSGIVFREEDRYWIPEIFRHGLGFRASGRPRVLAIANLVRRRNNLD